MFTSSKKSDNSLVLKTFLGELTNFINLLCIVLPNDKIMTKNKATFITCKKVNPRAVLTSWRQDVAEHFSKPIEENNLIFFINHDYENDTQLKDYSSIIIRFFESIKHSIQHVDNENKDLFMKYIQNISKISLLYKI